MYGGQSGEFACGYLGLKVLKHVHVSDQIGIWKCWVLRKGENWSTWRKTSQSKGENQQQNLPTLRQTRAT